MSNDASSSVENYLAPARFSLGAKANMIAAPLVLADGTEAGAQSMWKHVRISLKNKKAPADGRRLEQRLCGQAAGEDVDRDVHSSHGDVL